MNHRIAAVVAAVLVVFGTSPSPSRAVRFDELVRDDFFAGMAGDAARLEQGMRACEEALAVNTGHAQALVWHGVGLVFRANTAFRAGDRAVALDLMERGLGEMDRAAGLAPDDVGVLIPRAATLLRLAEAPGLADRAPAWVGSAVGGYRRALSLQEPRFAALSEHARGELLAGVAEGLDRLGNAEGSRDYLRRIVHDVPNSPYAERAARRLSGEAGAARQPLTCIGCHMD